MIFMSPALTMRLIAEEQKLGTLELLLTSPLREFEIVFGKFIAAFVTTFVMIVLSLYFVIVLFVYGDPDVGPLLSGLLGLSLYAAATLAVGLFASSLSSNQIVGLVVGSGILTALTIIDFVSERLTGVVSEVLDAFQLGASFSVFDLDSFGVAEGGHFADFARGIISLTDIAYYSSITAVFLLLTVLVLEARRWR
jgi:ABC-2 type transport system permease protein